MKQSIKNMLFSADIEMVQLAVIILYETKEIYDLYGKTWYRDNYVNNIEPTVFTKGSISVMMTKFQIRVADAEAIRMYQGINKFKQIRL